MSKRGSLVCVGCGIKGIAHLTLETVGWIRASDIVCYCCSDPATVIWIREQARETHDLAACYTEEDHRADIYQHMVDIMLSYVREGRSVCVVFYGHPGVFVYPTHVAIAKAREEGYAATMLPGVSAADCLFADVGFDPSQIGCVMYEATDLLLRHRTLSPDAHLIVWQIGFVGNPGFRFGRYENEHLPRVIECLSDVYGGDHRVCHYQASQFPICPPVVEWTRLRDLATHCQVSAISTLYVPPRVHQETDVALGERLGYLRSAAAANGAAANGAAVNGGAANGGAANGAARPPASPASRHYEPPPTRSALADTVNRMAVDPVQLAMFMQAPEHFIGGEGLNEAEAGALLSRQPARLRATIKAAG
jgi:precorrin-6B methylase 1